MTVQEQDTSLSEFVRRWERWRDEHEKALLDPHGSLAVTSLRRLDEQPTRFPDAPGAWSTGEQGVVVELDDGEELTVDGVPVRGRYGFGVIAERAGVSAVAGDAVIEVAKRGEIEFEIDGATHRLTAFNGRSPGSLQVLFTDATSGVSYVRGEPRAVRRRSRRTGRGGPRLQPGVEPALRVHRSRDVPAAARREQAVGRRRGRGEDPARTARRGSLTHRSFSRRTSRENDRSRCSAARVRLSGRDRP